MAADIKSLDDEIDKNETAQKDERKDALAAIEERYHDFITLYSSKEIVIAESQDEDVELKAIQAELEDVCKERDSLKEALFKEKSRIAKPIKLEIERLPAGSIESIANTINSKSSLGSVLELVQVLNPHTIELSGNCLKSATKNEQFNRQQKFFTDMMKLASTEFINEYQAKGSIGAFNYFTKSELAFQESKTTKESDCNRDFEFSDGKRTCNAHLRIGVDSKQQHMLRVYFSIEKGRVYIGEVTKHLPVSSD